MDLRPIPTTIIDLRAFGPPVRRVELVCKLTNLTSFAICILDAWLRVEDSWGATIAEGKLFYMQHAPANPAVIKPGQDGHGVIVIELPRTVLKHIEENRSGGDLKLRISSRALICEGRLEGPSITLGQPRQTQFDNGQLGHLEYLIPQSEWIKTLKTLAWSEIESIELPAKGSQTKASLTRALECFGDAQDRYRRGLWEETMVNCRKAFEALVKDTSGKDDMGQAAEAMKSLISDERKANEISEIIKALAPYLHLARHEQLPDVRIKPSDAQLALHITGALLAYVRSI
jgi:hypothetical protein